MGFGAAGPIETIRSDADLVRFTIGTSDPMVVPMAATGVVVDCDDCTRGQCRPEHAARPRCTGADARLD